MKDLNSKLLMPIFQSVNGVVLEGLLPIEVI